jgi:hypothetical protein
MSLFDMIKDKATELLGGASEKVSDLTGVDLPLGDAAGQAEETAADLTGAGQDIADTASAQGMDALGNLGPVGDAIDPNARS